jgi:uncharacterized protein
VCPILRPSLHENHSDEMENALRVEDENLIRSLVSADASYLSTNYDSARGFTLVIGAIVDGNLSLLRLLCELGAPLTAVAVNERLLTPMYIAAYLGHVDIIRALFESGVDVNERSIHGRTPLLIAACTGRVNVLRLLHNLGADLNCCDDGARGPVHMAAVFGQIGSIEVLHELGVDVAAAVQDCDGNTPVHAAAMFGGGNMLRWQLDLGAGFVNPAHGHAGIGADIPRADHMACLRALHRLGADISIPEANGCTPVYMAAASGQVEAIRTLHELGADVCTPANAGDTPVYAAAYRGHGSAIKALHALGADISVAAENGDNPVCAAAFNGHGDAIRVLAELGADLDARSHNGDTAACTAAFYGHEDALAALFEAGADLAAPGNGRCTPLHMSAWKGFVGCFLLLVNAGVDTRHLSRTAFELPAVMDIITGVRNGCACFGGNEVERYELHSLLKLSAGLHFEADSADEQALAIYLETHPIHMFAYRKHSYALRHRLMRLSRGVFRGACASIRGKSRAEIVGELVALLFNPDVLKDLHSLRVTCKYCEVQRRFPVSTGCATASVLEVHLIERFVGGDISYYVPTKDILLALNLHGVFQTNQFMDMFS